MPTTTRSKHSAASTRRPVNNSSLESSTNTRPSKRPRRDSNTQQASSMPSTSAQGSRAAPSQASAIPDRFGSELSHLTLSNFESAKQYWPMNRVTKQLAGQSSRNEVVGTATVALAQALLENFEHSLHMIAMISKCSVVILKRRLGLIGGTHGENTWHRWLSFSIEAQKHPMPVRGDPDAGRILTTRNKKNAAAYNSLSDDEFEIYTASVFFALGGYPNYSAVNITDIDNVGLDDVLVPEVPKLSEAEEARFRPIYDRSVDMVKVAKDRDANTPAVTASSIEKRSLQCYRKTAHQLARDGPLVGLDYLLIACSKSALGQGWCRVTSTQDDVLSWLNQKLNFEQLFPIYCQGKSDFEEIRLSIANAPATSNSAVSRPTQKCDILKGRLTAQLNAKLDAARGTTLPRKAFPRARDPINALKQRKIDVIIYRDPQRSTMTEAQWFEGYTGMQGDGRANWLYDCENNYFQILPPGGLPSNVGPVASGSGTGSVADGSTSATQMTDTGAMTGAGGSTSGTQATDAGASTQVASVAAV